MNFPGKNPGVGCHFLLHLYFLQKCKKQEDFPGGPVVENLPVSAGDMGLVPGWRRFHMLQGNSACAATAEPSCHNY